MDKYKNFSVPFSLLAGLIIFLGLVGCQDIFLLKQWGTIGGMQSSGTITTTPTLTWDAVDGADEYEVLIWPTLNDPGNIEPHVPAVSFLQVSPPLKNNTEYFWQVRALDFQLNNYSISREGAWSETWTFTVSTPDLNLVAVTGGSFYMGSPANEVNRVDNETQHTVTVNDFYISKYEITFDQYDAYHDATSVEKPSDNGWGRGTRPVINVSWNDAVGFLNWLSEQEKLTPVYTINGTEVTANFNANGYRLPTEAEWEYAARGGSISENYLYSGSDAAVDVAWYDGTSVDTDDNKKTYAVGEKKANELGLHDMSGSVWEWCWDWYGDDYYSVSRQSDPTGPASSSDGRVRRGGAWNTESGYLRSASRGYGVPSFKDTATGFRLVRNMPPPPSPL